MRCPSCGKTINKRNSYCIKCGLFAPVAEFFANGDSVNAWKNQVILTRSDLQTKTSASEKKTNTAEENNASAVSIDPVAVNSIVAAAEDPKTVKIRKPEVYRATPPDAGVSKTERPHFRPAVIGIIIASVLVVICIGAIIWAINYSKQNRNNSVNISRASTAGYEENSRETTQETTEDTEAATEETTDETTLETSDSESNRAVYLISVGNDKTGTVPLISGKWIIFYEVNGYSNEVTEHEQAQDRDTGSIIGLFILNVTNTPEELVKARMQNMEQAGAKNVTGAQVKIGGYDAFQCYGTYPDGVILVVWYFRGEDGLMRKVTVEFPSDNTFAFKLVEDGYTLDR